MHCYSHDQRCMVRAHPPTIANHVLPYVVLMKRTLAKVLTQQYVRSRKHWRRRYWAQLEQVRTVYWYVIPVWGRAECRKTLIKQTGITQHMSHPKRREFITHKSTAINMQVVQQLPNLLADRFDELKCSRFNEQVNFQCFGGLSNHFWVPAFAVTRADERSYTDAKKALQCRMIALRDRQEKHITYYTLVCKAAAIRRREQHLKKYCKVFFATWANWYAVDSTLTPNSAGTRTAQKQRKLLQTQRQQFEEEIDSFNKASQSSVTQQVIFDIIKDDVMSLEKSSYWVVRTSPTLPQHKDRMWPLPDQCDVRNSQSIEQLMLLQQDIDHYICGMQRNVSKFELHSKEQHPASITHFCELKVMSRKVNFR